MKVNQKGWKGLSARRRPAEFRLFYLFCALALLGVPSKAEAFDLSGGVSLGAIVVGAEPSLAVTPHSGISWRFESGFTFAIQDQFSILPATNSTVVGMYNQTSASVGFAWKTGDFTVGPSLSIYSMAACSPEWCGRIVGFSPGGAGQVHLYFAEPFGVSVSANLGWIGGESLVLPGGVAAMVVAGPVIRWSSR